MNSKSKIVLFFLFFSIAIIPFNNSSDKFGPAKQPIFFTQVALGASITIPSLRGELELKIPAGTKDKEQFNFKNEGVKSVQGYGIGSLVVQIKIKYPSTLNTEQKDLLEKLQESFGAQSKPHERNFDSMFDKVKNWFK